MNYDEILAVIKNKMAGALPELDVDDIDPKNNFTIYGANSVVIVDIISRVMKDLHIDAPGPELLRAQNIDQLILILLKYSKG